MDITTGKPLPNVTVVNKKNREIGNTGSDGTLNLSSKHEGSLRTIKGNDRFGPEISFFQITEHSYDAITAQFYSDLGVYRPGETIQWAIVVYRATDKGNTPWGDEEFQVIFKDPNYKNIDTVTVTSDEYGRIEGSFVIPKDRMNGRFFFCLEDINERINGWSVNVSEYKTPTFEKQGVLFGQLLVGFAQTKIVADLAAPFIHLPYHIVCDVDHAVAMETLTAGKQQNRYHFEQDKQDDEVMFENKTPKIIHALFDKECKAVEVLQSDACTACNSA